MRKKAADKEKPIEQYTLSEIRSLPLSFFAKLLYRDIVMQLQANKPKKRGRPKGSNNKKTANETFPHNAMVSTVTSVSKANKKVLFESTQITAPDTLANKLVDAMVQTISGDRKKGRKAKQTNAEMKEPASKKRYNVEEHDIFTAFMQRKIKNT